MCDICRTISSLKFQGRIRDVVWPRLIYLLGREDWDMGELAVLVRIQIDGVVEEVCPNAAIVQQRLSLARRAIATTDLPSVLAATREFSRFRFVFFTCSANAAYDRPV
jgi:hypothetical protein